MEKIVGLPLDLISEYSGFKEYLFLGTLSRNVNLNWSTSKFTSFKSINSYSRLKIINLEVLNIKPNTLIKFLIISFINKDYKLCSKIEKLLPKSHKVNTHSFGRCIVSSGNIQIIRKYLRIGTPGLFPCEIVNFIKDDEMEVPLLLRDIYSLNNMMIKIGRMCIAIVLNICDKDLIIKVRDFFDINMELDVDPYSIFKIASKDIDLFKWVIPYIYGENNTFIPKKLVTYVALSGNLEALQFILSMGGTFEENLCTLVSTRGLLNIFIYMVEICHENFDRNMCILFSREGSGIREYILTNT